MKSWLNFITHFIKHPHTSWTLSKGWGQKHIISTGELSTMRSQGFHVAPKSLQDRVHRLELSSSSTSCRLVYLQEARAVLRSQQRWVLCHGSKRAQVAGWVAVCSLVGSPATREEVTKAGSQSSALFYTRWLSSNLVSALSWLTDFLLPRSQSCPSPNCSTEHLFQGRLSETCFISPFYF